MAASKLDYIADGLRPLAVKMDSVAVDPANAMGHPDENLEAIRGSLAKYGQRKPIVVNRNDNVIEAGNGTWKAAKALGWAHIAAVFVDDDPTTATGYAIADNRTAQLASWDYETLARVLDEAFEEPTEIPGVSDAFLAEVMEEAAAGKDQADDPGAQVDKAAELQEKWQVETGDLWEIGAHRLICGDCTDGAVVERVMGGERAGAVVTDPPYGVGVDYGGFQDTQENVRALIKSIMPIILDNLPAALTPGVPAMWDYPRPAWVGAWIHPAANSSGPWGFVGANPILYYGKDPYLSAGKGRRDSSLVAVADRKGESDHPVSKPLNVWAWLVERMTPDRGMIVLDPFIGSGTTAVACEQLHRRCFGIEIHPPYVAVSLQRLADLGLEPHLVED